MEPKSRDFAAKDRPNIGVAVFAILSRWWILRADLRHPRGLPWLA